MVPRPEATRLMSPGRLPRPTSPSEPLPHRMFSKHAASLHNRRAHLQCAQPLSAPCAASSATQQQTNPDAARRRSPADAPRTGHLHEASTYSDNEKDNSRKSIRHARTTDRSNLPSKDKHSREVRRGRRAYQPSPGSHRREVGGDKQDDLSKERPRDSAHLRASPAVRTNTII